MLTRPMSPRDRRYVVPTWAQSARYGLHKRKRFALVDRILDLGTPVVCLASDELTVHAWACGIAGTLHYVYVPPELRGNGLARRVITAAVGGYPEHINVTHKWPRESARFRYAPSLLETLIDVLDSFLDSRKTA